MVSTEFQNLVNGLVIFGRYLCLLSSFATPFNIIILRSFQNYWTISFCILKKTSFTKWITEKWCQVLAAELFKTVAQVVPQINPEQPCSVQALSSCFVNFTIPQMNCCFLHVYFYHPFIRFVYNSVLFCSGYFILAWIIDFCTWCILYCIFHANQTTEYPLIRILLRFSKWRSTLRVRFFLSNSNSIWVFWLYRRGSKVSNINKYQMKEETFHVGVKYFNVLWKY